MNTCWDAPPVTFTTRILLYIHLGVSKNNGIPKSSHFNRVFHEINHPFWGFYPYFRKHQVFADDLNLGDCLMGGFTAASTCLHCSQSGSYPSGPSAVAFGAAVFGTRGRNLQFAPFPHTLPPIYCVYKDYKDE